MRSKNDMLLAGSRIATLNAVRATVRSEAELRRLAGGKAVGLAQLPANWIPPTILFLG
jgi:hypothetical protein